MSRSQGDSPFGTRRSTRLVAAAIGIGFFAGLQGVTAAAEIIPGQAAMLEMLKSQNGDEDVNVVIGGTVAQTTDQKGNLGGFNIFISNGQITGDGSGEVTIPVGPDDETETIDVESTPGEVQTFTTPGGAFKDPMPISLTTTVKVNGEEVDPDLAYGISGDVDITYHLNNLTNRTQTVTWDDIYGNQHSKQMEVPVPIGGTFGMTFGDGWFIHEVEGLPTPDPTPEGTKLFGKVLIFPIIPGAVGTTEAKVKIKATADDASLPATLLNAVPVDLSAYVDGLALSLVPGIEQNTLVPASDAISGIATDIAQLADPLAGFAGALDQMNQNDLQPLLDSIAELEVDPEELSGDLSENSEVLVDLGELLEANEFAQNQVSALLTAMSRLVGDGFGGLVDGLGEDLGALGPAAGEASQALRALDGVMSDLDPVRLQAAVAGEDRVCEPVGNTSEARGQSPLPAPLDRLYGGSDTWNALQNAIADPGLAAQQANLQQLQNQLNTQVNQTLLPKLLSGPLAESTDNELLARAKCKTTNKIVRETIIPLGQKWSDLRRPVLRLATLLAVLDRISDRPNLGNGPLDRLADLLRGVGRLLSNDNCSVDALLGPLADAGDSPEDIAAALGQVLSNCGLAQILEFLGAVDGAIGGAVGTVGTLLETASEDTDSIATGVDNLATTAETAANALDELPPALNQVVADIQEASGTVSEGGQEALGDVSSTLAEIDAMLNAMTARTLAGDGVPYGASTGTVPVKSQAAFQLAQTQAQDYSADWTIGAAAGLGLGLIGAGIGTVLYRRRAGGAGEGA